MAMRKKKTVSGSKPVTAMKKAASKGKGKGKRKQTAASSNNKKTGGAKKKGGKGTGADKGEGEADGEDGNKSVVVKCAQLNHGISKIREKECHGCVVLVGIAEDGGEGVAVWEEELQKFQNKAAEMTKRAPKNGGKNKADDVRGTFFWQCQVF